MIRLGTILLFLGVSLSTAQTQSVGGTPKVSDRSHGITSADSTRSQSVKTVEETKPNSSQPQVSQQQTVPPVASVHGTETAKMDQSGQPHDWIDKVNAGSTLVIATFTILMFIGVILQVWTSRDTERAWIVVNPVETCPPVGFVPGSSRIEQSTVGANQRNVFACSIKNTGETPARLVSVAVLYRTVAKLTDIPGEPDYGRLELANNMLLVKSDSIGAAAYLEPEPILSGADSLAVHRAQMFLYAFGIVKYKDVFNRLHETRFGYIYHFPQGGDPMQKGFRRDGLPGAYNGAS